jgi:hypothetical protein
MYKLAVVGFVLFASVVRAGDLAVTLTPEYGGGMVTRQSSYKHFPGRDSSGTDFKAPSSGLSVNVRDGRWAGATTVSYAATRSESDWFANGSSRMNHAMFTEAVGSAVGGQAVGQFYLVRWFHLDGGGQYTRLDEHSHIERTTWSQRAVIVGPAVGAGVNASAGRVNFRMDSTWYPWLHRRDMYHFATDGLAAPVYSETMSGRGYASRVAIRVRLASNAGISGAWQYRRLNDDGPKPYILGLERAPRSQVFRGFSIGLSVRL